MWHYLNPTSNSPCSAELEVVSSAESLTDADVLALLSLPTIPEKCCSPGNGTECSPSSPCGTMCAHSGMITLPAQTTSTHLEGSAIASLSQVDFLAPIFPSLAKEQASKENTPDCGPKWPGSLARYNPGSRSWRTAQCSLLGGLTEYSATFPRWGTMQSGELWERTTPVLRIEGNESGLWRTPTFHDFKNSSCSTQIYLSDQVMQRPKKLVPFPTPRAQEPGRTTEGYGRGLAELVEGKSQRKANTPSGNWPTPTCADAFTDKLKSAQQSEGSMHSVNLSQAVKMFPTPTATDYKGAYTKESMVSSGGIDRAGLLRNVGHMDNPEYKAADGGQLNPAWVCWLIGWPLGWDHMDPLNPEAFRAWLLAFQNGPTALKPSATVKSLPPPRLHGIPSTPASNKEAEAA